MKLRAINEKFTEEDYNEIKAIKESTGMGWHDFLLHAARAVRDGTGSTKATEPKEEMKNVLVPESGRVRLTEAAGKEIEWGVKE